MADPGAGGEGFCPTGISGMKRSVLYGQALVFDKSSNATGVFLLGGL